MPRNLTCPNCEKPSIAYWRKQFLGPARTIDCGLCGARISVSTIHFIPLLLFIVATPVTLRKLGLLEHAIASYAGTLVFMLFVTGLYQHYLVPLVVRSRRTNE